MTDRETLEHRIAFLGVELDAARHDLQVAQERVTDLYGEQKRARDQLFESFTDEELLADDALLVRLCQASYSGEKASERKNKLMDPGVEGVGITGYDGRDEYREKVLPNLQLTLRYRQDVEPVAAGIEAWTKRFALGRTDIRIGVMDHTLSEGGFWFAHYDLATGTTTLFFQSYGRATERFAGTLRAALKYLAEDAWYEGGPGEDYDTDSPYDF